MTTKFSGGKLYPTNFACGKLFTTKISGVTPGASVESVQPSESGASKVPGVSSFVSGFWLQIYCDIAMHRDPLRVPATTLRGLS